MDVLPSLLDVNLGAFLVAVSALLLYFWWKPGPSPPGPWLVPFLGIIPGIVANMQGPYLTKWFKQYKSRIVQIRVMGVKVVVIDTADLIKDAFIRRSDLADRLEVNGFNVVEPTHEGILFSSGQIWKNSRRVTLRMMRDFGMSNNNASVYITHECEILVSEFGKYKGSAFSPAPYFMKATTNVMNCFLFRKRFDYDDRSYNEALRCMNAFSHEGSGTFGFFVTNTEFGKWIFRERMKAYKKNWEVWTGFVQKQIDNHIKDFNGVVNDLVDAFLDEVEQGVSKFNSSQIRSNVLDMFIAGGDTTNIQLQWLILYMAKYQKVQQRVYEELINNFPSKVPDVMNRRFTPYTEAVINEVMRVNTLLQFGVPRTNVDHDFEIEGYKFPKGTPVMANYWGLHHDPKVFKNPEQFDPENFLTESNELHNHDRMISYAIGRRSCAGESLARMEIYLFFTMIVLRLKILSPENVDVDLKPVEYSGSVHPQDYKVRLFPRHEE